MTAVLAIVLAAYLIGAVPFGYWIGRLKGVNLFEVGSGNIGATNAGRILGRKWGVLVFVLDFAKGALPVAAALPLARLFDAQNALGQPDAVRVAVALAAFLGHLFPIYLGFRGGKGVATGTGAVAILMPGPTLAAALVWLAVVCAYRQISLGSIVAVGALCIAYFLTTLQPFGPDALILTLFCISSALLVLIRHRGNAARLARGAESRLDDNGMLQHMRNAIHVVAVGLWFGGSVMFTMFAASLFPSFQEVVLTAPSDRTANLPLAPAADEKQKEQLAAALAGAAAGPMFPRFFALQAVAGCLALITALGWRKSSEKIHRLRPLVIGVALLGVVAGWALAMKVSELRPLRYSADPAIAQTARDAFGPWHQASLLLNFATLLLVFAAMVMSGRLPERKPS